MAAIIPAYFIGQQVSHAFSTLNERLKTYSDESDTTATFKQRCQHLIRINLSEQDRVKVPLENLVFERQDPETVKVSLHYEIRQHFMYNIDLVVNFVDTALLPYRRSQTA